MLKHVRGPNHLSWDLWVHECCLICAFFFDKHKKSYLQQLIHMFIKQRLVVSPACLHFFIIGLLKLIIACQGGPQLLTHFLSVVKTQGVTVCSLNQENPGIAATTRIHCREREKIQVQVTYRIHHHLDTVHVGGSNLQVTGSVTAYVFIQ